MKEGWKVVKIKDICDKASSNIAQKDLNDNEGEYPIYGASGFIKNVDFYQRSEPYIGIVKDGSGVGRVSLYPAFSSLLGTLQYIIPKYENDISFVYYALQSLSLSKFSVGAAIPHIYFKDYGECEIAVPPLPEQHRIVKKLDAAFEKIDAMKAKAEKNIENAKALFQQTLAEELEPKEGWVEKKIKDIGEVVGGTTPNTSNKEFWNGDRCWISPAELHGEHYLYDSARKITELAVKSKNLKELPVGTVILSSRAPIGKVAINKVPMYCNQGFKCVVCGDSIYNEFLYWWFYGKTEYLNTLGTGATFLEISKTIVENIGISIPMLIEQQQIVTKLDILSAKCKKLEEAERKTIAECDALKQAILRQAFNGEL